MSSPGSDALTIELPARLATDRAVAGLLVACALTVEAVLARYPDGPVGIGLAAGILLAFWHSWLGRRSVRVRTATLDRRGDWQLGLADGRRVAAVLLRPVASQEWSLDPFGLADGLGPTLTGPAPARRPAPDIRADVRRRPLSRCGGRPMKPMANFPPSDGSMQTQEARDAEPRPASGVEQSDLELVRRVQRGERGAFDLLVLRYQHKVVKLVARLLRDPAEAEDVAQEAFVKAYRALASFRGDSAFYTWLYRIAVNTARNAMASRQRRPLDYEADLSETEQSAVASRMSHSDTPEASALSDEIHATVNRAVAELPEDLRTAIILREIEGLSYEEIAAAMDCPVGTVRSRIFRAREAIDRDLKPLLD